MNNTIIEKIQQVKKQKNACILAHNYQPPEIQDIADYTGDSLGLSVIASKTDADVIVFCGVLFMAETAAILSPEKTVLLPEINAGCPMADMINADQLAELKAKHPDALVVCYVNSTAEVKALSDYCCTSANAVELVNTLPADKKILFVPDQNLGQFTAERTGRDIILWPGYCRSHVFITDEDIKLAKAKHPNALVLTHPECTKPVKDLSDQLLSTGQMLKFVSENDCTEYIIATELGIIHSLKKQSPDAKYYPASEKAYCENMKKITLEKLLFALEDNKYIINVPTEIAAKAKNALEKMIQVIPA